MTGAEPASGRSGDWAGDGAFDRASGDHGDHGDQPGNPAGGDGGAPADPPPGGDGVFAATGEAWRAARARLGTTVDLAAAEAELAIRAGVGILILAALAIVAVLTGWGFLVAALATAAVAAGLPWPAVALGFAIVHCVLAAALLWLAAVLSRDLTLPALRRALRGDGP